MFLFLSVYTSFSCLYLSLVFFLFWQPSSLNYAFSVSVATVAVSDSDHGSDFNEVSVRGGDFSLIGGADGGSSVCHVKKEMEKNGMILSLFFHARSFLNFSLLLLIHLGELFNLAAYDFESSVCVSQLGSFRGLIFHKLGSVQQRPY